MKKTPCNICPQIIRFASYAICSVFFIGAADAAVVARDTTPSAPAAVRPSMGRTANIATTAAPAGGNAAIADTAITPSAVTTAAATVSVTPEISIANKSSQFENVVGTASTSAVDSSAANLAELIQRQRDALDAASGAAAQGVQTTLSGRNACDTALRNCMQTKCGKDYSKCKGDGDTIWGDKMDSCRRETTCTGQEYALFVPEIKADRDMNAKIGAFTAIIDCGNSYNDCIVEQCGTTYNKCLGKAAGDAAIAKCATIAKNCTQQDSGLASRTMNVFGTLRQSAEVQIQKDEKRLYALRDEMRSQCARLGAMLDERSLDCVFTVNLYAGSESKLFASKKAYAGSTFDCNQNWFGIDITTFKENAYRETRAQESAVKSFMGAGMGTAVGAVTSGVVSRAMDRHKAEKALKKAKDEAKDGSEGGGDAEAKKLKKEERAAEKAKKKEEKTQKKEERAAEKAKKKEEKTQKKEERAAEKAKEKEEKTQAKAAKNQNNNKTTSQTPDGTKSGPQAPSSAAVTTTPVSPADK